MQTERLRRPLILTFNMMTIDEIFEAIGGAYLAFNLLEEPINEDLASITALAGNISDSTVSHLIKGEDWRERAVGIVLACHRDVANFYHDYLDSFHLYRGGISLFPTACAIIISAKHFSCDFGPKEVTYLSSNPSKHTGALSYIQFYLGQIDSDPNDYSDSGQKFEDQYRFYCDLCRVEQGA